MKDQDPTVSLKNEVTPCFGAVVHLSLLTGFGCASPKLGWRVAPTSTVWLLQPLSHLSVLCSAGNMDSAYEGQNPGISAVALYDYQGGGSAVTA